MKNAIANIVNKVLVTQFYKQHTIVLAIVYMVMFGSVPGHLLWNYHTSLIHSILPNIILISFVFLLWIIYSIKLLYFLVHQIKQHSLIQQISLLPTQRQYLIVMRIVFICLIPISSYACFIMIYGLKNGFLLSALAIIIFQIVVHFCICFLLFKNIQNQEAALPYLPSFSIKSKKKYAIQFYIKFLLNKQALQFSLIKLISIITITACFYSHKAIDEIRFSTFFYGMIICMHFKLVRQFILWQFSKMHWSLPIKTFTICIQVLLFCIVLLLPEIIYLLKATPLHLTNYNCLSLILYSIGGLAIFYAILIAMQNMEQEAAPLLGLFLFFTYVCALSNSLLLYSSILLVMYFIIYKYNIKKFELQAQIGEDSFS